MVGQWPNVDHNLHSAKDQYLLLLRQVIGSGIPELWMSSSKCSKSLSVSRLTGVVNAIKAGCVSQVGEGLVQALTLLLSFGTLTLSISWSPPEAQRTSGTHTIR